MIRNLPLRDMYVTEYVYVEEVGRVEGMCVCVHICLRMVCERVYFH